MHGALLLLLSVFTCCVFSSDSCRQCSGDVTLILNGLETEPNVQPAAKLSVGGCATGNDFSLGSPQSLGCDTVHKDQCRSFKYSLQAWRFCFNGGAATFSRNIHVKTINYDGTAVLKYNLKCTRSVDCKGGSCSAC